jgi:Rho-type GTPase-activating protein 1/2
MFGRELTEQVKADIARGFTSSVPVIVAKCIEAVEALGMLHSRILTLASYHSFTPLPLNTLSALDFEGIYRKTGGSGQSKIITQLFERGDYASFDLLDQDRFNDICSVTSVLKNYFRSLPTPLLTFDLHDDFMMAAEIKDVELKGSALTDLVRKLPQEHHETLRVLMLHLYR